MFSEGGRGIYDRFRGRLIWPIRDIAGDTIGFGARKLYEDDQGPKYLNTPETALYKKSQVLYGIDLAKRNIAKDRQLVVVEGYTDVMACHLAGIPTAVATCGTAFGTEHIKIARRLLSDDGSGGEVIFTFDGDAAGQKAALRAFEEDQRFVAQTYVAVEPNGADPCELRQSKGDAAVRDLIGTRRPLFEFAIRAALKRHNLDTVEGRIAALRESAPVVAQIRDAGIRPAYARELSGWLGMPVEEVSRAVGAAAKRAAQPPSGSAGSGRQGQGNSQGRGSGCGRRDPRRELRPCRRRPSCRPSTGRTRATPWPRWNGRRWRLPSSSPGCWKVRPGSGSPRRGSRRRPTWPSTRPSGPAGLALTGDPVRWVEQLLQEVPEPLRPLVSELSVVPLPASTADGVLRYCRDILARLFELQITRVKAEKMGQLQRLDASSDPEEFQRLNRELMQLEMQRRSLRSEA